MVRGAGLEIVHASSLTPDRPFPQVRGVRLGGRHSPAATHHSAELRRRRSIGGLVPADGADHGVRRGQQDHLHRHLV